MIEKTEYTKKVDNVIVTNKKGLIVACLFIEKKTGNLMADSWTCHKGWE
jgi:hypothetical protein